MFSLHYQSHRPVWQEVRLPQPPKPCICPLSLLKSWTETSYSQPLNYCTVSGLNWILRCSRGATTISKLGVQFFRPRYYYLLQIKIRQVYTVWCSRLHNHTLFIKKLCEKLGVRPNFGGSWPPIPQWLRPCFLQSEVTYSQFLALQFGTTCRLMWHQRHRWRFSNSALRHYLFSYSYPDFVIWFTNYLFSYLRRLSNNNSVITRLSVVPMFTRNHLLSVLCMVSYNFYLLLFHSVSTPICLFLVWF